MTSSVQAQIRQAMDSWVQAMQSKDVERIIRHYREDVVAYDAIGPLRFVGREAYKAHWQACMEMCDGPSMVELHEPSFMISGDLGVVHFLFHCGGTDDKGQMQSCWMRVTQCFRQEGNQWLIAHEHFSMPCDMESGKTLSDLTP
ncbi:MAG: nuclear transport factor 2 family protein [Pseudomonadota bacterium]